VARDFPYEDSGSDDGNIDILDINNDSNGIEIDDKIAARRARERERRRLYRLKETEEASNLRKLKEQIRRKNRKLRETDEEAMIRRAKENERRLRRKQTESEELAALRKARRRVRDAERRRLRTEQKETHQPSDGNIFDSNEFSHLSLPITHSAENEFSGNPDAYLNVIYNSSSDDDTRSGDNVNVTITATCASL
jgi:hypothetical protein